MWGEIDYIEEIEWGDNWEEERMNGWRERWN